ncbi:MAG: M28 family peptidase [Deltaproteobacteria bacterium]|nr:M28 family peptidase [Deltaproteobacteria bacterium]NCS74621.1 M28 family peptidase [Deltaproteobacteria bacterium]PIX83285.1 MAG: peptidase M28 [Nitrospirae bacterium CG_4_10_14_3_um_filter_70_108]PJB95874.1 MAG: peptidase M28 [Nitrospirae bacterium CG_4_9_14_0_8_um_filter_70_14]
MRCALLVVVLACLLAGCQRVEAPAGDGFHAGRVVAPLPGEGCFARLRQLTFGGDNAEAYWAADGRRLVFQATWQGGGCDQIYTLDLATGARRLVSTGSGRTTCSYFFDHDRHILFASTHAAAPDCPEPPDPSHGYVWPLYPSYDLYRAEVDGSHLTPWIALPGYTAEATTCRQDDRILFTQVADGDIDLYVAEADGSRVRRITATPGYDGGAFFSDDCGQIVWRASRFKEPAKLADFRALLARDLVRPSAMDLWVANGEGEGARQITYLPGASFAPSFLPGGRAVIFASNWQDPAGRTFDLYTVAIDGSHLTRVTQGGGFNAFPMFSPDGRWLAFASNRYGRHPHETNLFVAEWRGEAEGGEAIPTPVDPYMADVRWLADPARAGRRVGTAGIEAAADYLARRFAEAGALPAGDPAAGGPSWFQTFEVTVGVRLEKGTRLTAGEERLRPEVDYLPAAFSASGPVAGTVVFGGYGIEAPELHWDDYDGLDVRHKVVLALRDVPAGGNEGVFASPAGRRYSDPRYKAFIAREHGAAALLLVAAEGEGEEALPPLAADAPESEAGIPVLYLSRASAARWLAAQGSDLATLRARVEAGDPPVHGVALPHLDGEVVLARTRATTRNVIGVVPGSDPQAAPLLLGAHYDHLGHGGAGSLAPDRQAIHPGADDNASGSALLIDLIGRLKAAHLRRPVVVAALTGEEIGLAGSSHLARNLPVAAAHLRAMLNFDMVGRLTDNQLTVFGTDSAAELKGVVEAACAGSPLTCQVGGDGFGPSDMTPFYAANLPVLFFTTGPEADYHRPTDTADRVNGAGAIAVAKVAVAVVAALAGDTPLTLQRTGHPLAQRAEGGGYGAYFGIVPDPAALAGDGAIAGVTIAGCRAGSPAQQAGLAKGDVIVALGGHPVANLRDLAFCLRGHQAGEQVAVRYRRGAAELTAEATLGKR